MKEKIKNHLKRNGPHYTLGVFTYGLYLWTYAAMKNAGD